MSVRRDDEDYPAERRQSLADEDQADHAEDEDEVVVPRRGLRFEHARMKQGLINTPIAACPPVICRVTAIRAGVAYYRTNDGEGTKYRTTPEKFPEYVGRILPDA